MKKTHVLFCAESLDMNGAMKSLLALLAALPRERYALSLFLCSHAGVLMNELPRDVRVLPERTAYAVFRLSFLPGLRRALRGWRPDLALLRLMVPVLRWLRVPTPRWWAFRPAIPGEWDLVLAYADGIIGEIAVRKVRTGRKFLWVHTDYRICPPPRETAWAFADAAGAVAVSKDAAQGFRTWFASVMGRAYDRPVHVIYNIIDATHIRCLAARADAECPPPPPGVARLVTVGRLTAQKNVKAIPVIADMLKRRGVRFEWVVVGGGPDLAWCLEESRRLGVEGMVRFVGESRNPMGWVASADVVVQPSVWEGWGMTVSEALVLRKPVVATDLPVLREQIRDGMNGLLVDNKPEAFAEAIARLLDDEALRARMAGYEEDYPFSPKRVCEGFHRCLVEGSAPCVC